MIAALCAMLVTLLALGDRSTLSAMLITVLALDLTAATSKHLE